MGNLFNLNHRIQHAGNGEGCDLDVTELCGDLYKFLDNLNLTAEKIPVYRCIGRFEVDIGGVRMEKKVAGGLG